MPMLESQFQSKLIKELKKLFPGCIVMKSDSGYLQGIPDLLILFSSAVLSKPTSSPAAAVTSTPALERVHTIDNKEISDIMEPCR